MPDDKIIHDSSKLAADSYLCTAIRDIDSAFGKGYAHDHPELVAAFMQTAVADYASGIASATMAATVTQICEVLDRIANAIENVADQIGSD